MSSVKFGTSGLRGLAHELAGAATQQYVAAFLAALEADETVSLGAGGPIFLGQDLRQSSPDIVADCAAAIVARGYVPIDCGAISTPALAHYAMGKVAPSIMVTGSHIPADRNGLKFYRPDGEITKADETAIVDLAQDVDSSVTTAGDIERDHLAAAAYRERYAALLVSKPFSGLRIGVFEHSSVARDDLAWMVETGGGEAIRLGRVETFVPVDTEAFNDDVFAPLPGWIEQHRLDGIISTDGDGDRPLLMDEMGNFVRGDVLGGIAALMMSADCIVTPISSNSGVERLNTDAKSIRTRIGSPFVIAGMEEGKASGFRRVIGFEPNGGTLVGTDTAIMGQRVSALPTRDALLPLICTLLHAQSQKIPISQMVANLPFRAAMANRLTDVDMMRAAKWLTQLTENESFSRDFLAPLGEVANSNFIDGARFELGNGDIIHFRGSGNAPEMRCYVEAGNERRAQALLKWGLDAAGKAVRD
ncbi:phosphomannomutase [Pelagibacterium lentulum]|uniref:Phosphomannomutase n=1 Tax=Pelagibacterium lentulum TaxID=2029865 RepID=A0A916RKZ6_9HYPH|nr:phosphomannomutase [Pelagibacterium lentulum]GGA61249.1 phosphomannomutase [Pelagibacterium lentulum]